MLAMAAALGAVGCAGRAGQSPSAVVPEIRPGILIGYLERKELPNALALLAPPPAAGSTAMALDEAVRQQATRLRDTPRWTLATADAELGFPAAAGTFSCVLDAPISEQDTPHLYMLLRRSMTDAGLSTYTAKEHYSRIRPFAMHRQPTCAPGDEAQLAKDGSYPSGHSAIGWAWALILTEVAPDRADAILARGQAFGQSRVVCNVHWQSDVTQGRTIGAGAVARLHGNAAFRTELKAAKAELAAVREKGLRPTRDCAMETEALAHK
ncbi:MAG: phosphatase PAP2 family protein [Deltaproteobacteria bacterium]|nr:phosphatase PAP2 family protein [Deltaproteobacteria bacterium]